MQDIITSLQKKAEGKYEMDCKSLAELKETLTDIELVLLTGVEMALRKGPSMENLMDVAKVN